ncbi:MAG: hypothetical protein KME11_06015 [Timaviella obliquedivisa GSE-PSE-MK23-08B]|nr:hypothetical protein [Timaviella obliquedivisa GSE-PSE-MK23-08B]
MRVERVKKCDRCLCPAPVLYRVQYDASQQWLFVCDRCFPSMSQDNLNYRYGGTWKARKKP